MHSDRATSEHSSVGQHRIQSG